jgi:hypothetical protein
LVQIKDLEEERYQWALQEQMEWFRFNLDPYYPYYQEDSTVAALEPANRQPVDEEEAERDDHQVSVLQNLFFFVTDFPGRRAKVFVLGKP